MYIFPMNHLKTMHSVPKVDRRIVGYGIAWILAIGAGITLLLV